MPQAAQHQAFATAHEAQTPGDCWQEFASAHMGQAPGELSELGGNLKHHWPEDENPFYVYSPLISPTIV